MGTTARAFSLRDLTQHGKQQISRTNINFGKVLPASTTGNLFTVTGSIHVHGLVGVVSTALSVTAVSPTIGITGSPALIAAAPAVALASTVVGSVLQMPTALGGQLPAPVAASGNVLSASSFILSNTTITITTGATNTGAVTWLLIWEPAFPKLLASTAVVNN